MTSTELNARFKQWAITMILFTRHFPADPAFSAIRNQMVRCAPAAAANYRAACRAKSNPDFINKLKITEEELDESMFWLELVVGIEPSLRPEIVAMYREADELISIIVASISKLRKNQKNLPSKRSQSNQSDKSNQS